MSDLPEQTPSYPEPIGWLVVLGLLAIAALVLWFVFSHGSEAGPAPGPKFAPWAPLP